MLRKQTHWTKHMKVKVSILTAAIAAAVSASAMAEIQPLSGDQFTVGGEVGVGGYYKESDKAFNTGATGLTIKTSYKNGPVVGYLEVDADADYGKNKADDIETDLDKLWVGYDFGFGVLSYGVENDSALDKVDGAGDLTVDFGFGAGSTGDGFDVIKFEGKNSGFAYGVSYFETDEETNVADEDTEKDTKVGDKRGYNGYFGYEHDMFSVYAGYEKLKNDDKVATLTGNVDLDVIKLGANLWREDDGTETDGFYLSAAKSFGAFEVSAGYGEANTDIDDKNFNIGVNYDVSDNVYIAADYQYDKNEGSDNYQNVYLKAGYTF